MLITLDPTPGFDIWEKVSPIRSELPDLKAILAVGGSALQTDGALDFDTLVESQPADGCVSARRFDPLSAPKIDPGRMASPGMKTMG